MKKNGTIHGGTNRGPRREAGAGRTLALAFVIAFTGAVTPGPMLALVIGQVLAQGMKAALWILAGHALIEVVFIGILARGLTGVLARPGVRSALSFVGGIVMLWMGWETLARADSASVRTAAGNAIAALPLVAAGIGVSLSNPYFTGWWATVGTGQLAALRLRTKRDYLIFFVGHELGDIVWYIFVAALLVLGRWWLSDPVYRLLLGACGALILALGLFFLGLGIRTLTNRKQEPSATEEREVS